MRSILRRLITFISILLTLVGLFFGIAAYKSLNAFDAKGVQAAQDGEEPCSVNSKQKTVEDCFPDDGNSPHQQRKSAEAASYFQLAGEASDGLVFWLPFIIIPIPLALLSWFSFNWIAYGRLKWPKRTDGDLS